MSRTLISTPPRAAKRTRRIELHQPLTAPDTAAAERMIPIAQPRLPGLDRVLPRLERLLSQPQLTNASEVRRFEDAAALALGVSDCIAVSSCTSGLMLVEKCLGLTGEVILPSFTFFASGHSLLWNGLTPVFADCERDTFNIDPGSVERRITERTSAILAVHVFGCPAALEELEHIARRRGLRLIVDGAHAMGARIHGTGVCRWGDATVFSLSPTKPLVTCEGGLIATNDPELAERLRRGRNYGKGAGYDCDILGLNARMTEMQAVLGDEGLADLEDGIRHRNDVAAAYEQVLGAVPGIRLQKIPAGHVSSRKDFALLVEPEFGASREDVERTLAEHRVESRRYFDPPMHRQTLYERFYNPAQGVLRETDAVANRVVCLPIHSGVSIADAHWIASKIAALGRRQSTAA